MSKLLMILERVRRGATLDADERGELSRGCCCWPPPAIDGSLTDEGVSRLRKRPLSQAELDLLRAAKTGKHVAKVQERSTLKALAEWGLVADWNGRTATLTAWGLEVLAYQEGGGR
jgi:hypothetical protein